ncbi:MAG: diaminopimelate decarboxylase [Actinomycetota bacterium]|nr:diaminopimelate decarboxylase [Acidimicrobiaceae bacterium]MBD17157.1 diaminopimelate decarboxylase [Actinomycetota bacterium]MEC7607684.1 diaminopimelate decarboxylase [Actinomycetota bacterium]MEC8119777.1 diaminopimelate decarboxylase [Actinomycetota bacterium]MEC8334877.1 diaminopimelate decarboxylase [Actinomycetota bacterium]|tara:strand:+ start:192 stop:1466 length:1275 start_codon:yes stop_codon:yes gene_type:complete
MAERISRALLPDNTSVADDGMAMFGGVRVDDLVAQFGTPLFVYDEDHIRRRCQEAVKAFPDGVSYASKAFLCKAIAKLVHEEGMGLDVATIGEAYIALQSGVPASDLTLHGNNKSMEELRYAVDNGIGKVVIDSFDEIDKIEHLYATTKTPIKALVRVTPGVEAYTHKYVTTGQVDSKFGFTVQNGQAGKAIERARSSGAIDLIGLHAHIGSQIFTSDSFRKSTDILVKLAEHFGLPELCVGGGLGVPYLNDESSIPISEWGAIVHDISSSSSATLKITSEPGRSIVASSAVTIYTVGTIKEIEGVRTYVAVDGGMHDNPRPALYGSDYETFLARSINEPRKQKITLVGKHCESGDVLVKEGDIQDDLVVGDLLVTPVTGAYGHSMGSNYNKVLRPAVVFVQGGKSRLVLRREELSDLLNSDVT